MKSRYKRKAWYLDEDILLYGYVDKRGFHPDKGLQCGFGTQRVNKKQKDRTLFYSLDTAKKVLGSVRTAGGNAIYTLDVGYATTKVMENTGFPNKGHRFALNSNDLGIKKSGDIANEDIARIIANCLHEAGYDETSHIHVDVGIMVRGAEEENHQEYETTVEYEGCRYHMILDIQRIRRMISFFVKGPEVGVDIGGTVEGSEL